MIVFIYLGCCAVVLQNASMNAKNRVSWCAEVGFWWNFVFPLGSDESLAVLGGEDDVQVIGDVGVRHKCDGGVERVACRTYGARVSWATFPGLTSEAS